MDKKQFTNLLESIGNVLCGNCFEGNWSDFSEKAEQDALEKGWRFYLTHNFFNLGKDHHKEAMDMLNSTNNIRFDDYPHVLKSLHSHLRSAGVDVGHPMMDKLYDEAEERHQDNVEKARARAR